jgi:hypothetical protein
MRFDHQQDQIIVTLRDNAGVATETALDPAQWWALLELALRKYLLLKAAYDRAKGRAEGLRSQAGTQPSLPAYIGSPDAMYAWMEALDQSERARQQADEDESLFKAQLAEAAQELVDLADMRGAAPGQAWLRVVIDGQPYALGIARDARRAASALRIECRAWKDGDTLEGLG